MAKEYGVIYQDIFDSSLAINHEARWVFGDLVVLADGNDNVMMDDVRISLRTRAPLETVRKALAFLLEPDLDSKSHLEEGRRLTEILNAVSGRVIGYHVVNRHYWKRQMSIVRRREYMRSYRAKKLEEKWKTDFQKREAGGS